MKILEQQRQEFLWDISLYLMTGLVNINIQRISKHFNNLFNKYELL
jgi:hypothetical protein